MYDVKEGDRVRYRGMDLRWEYPRKELEARFRPSGAGAWSSTLDGVAGYRNIELRVHAAPMGGEKVDECVEEAVPQVVSILTGGKRVSSRTVSFRQLDYPVSGWTMQKSAPCGSRATTIRPNPVMSSGSAINRPPCPCT